MKKLVLGSVILLGVSSLIGCSVSKGKEAATVPAGEKSKELVIVMQEGTIDSSKYRVTSFQKSAKLFEEANPGVKVTVEQLPSKGYMDALIDRLNNKPVDLIFSNFHAPLNEREPFADLLPFIKADKMTTDDLYETMIGMATLKGKLLGIPMAPNPLAIFYNKEWFDKAGVPYPAKDWTWEQFMNVSIKLQAANRVSGKEIFGSAVPLDMQVFESLAQSSGQSVTSPDGNRMSGYLNSKPVAEALTKLLYHMNTSKASKSVSSYNQVLTELKAFNAGMGIGTATMFSFLEAPPNAGKFGIAALPQLENGVRANALTFHLLSIAANSKQKELAWKFMKDVILNGDSQFQKDWGKQELLTSKSAIQKSGQHQIPGMNVLVDEFNYAFKPITYRNAALSSVRIEDKRLFASTTEAEVMAALSDIAEEIDKQLKDKK
ncbi:MAG: sugar transporter substrate-binding protein [Paenibacillus sp.]|nr:sugar transporter substrate-binding protein [Paenibacillus sp.]